MTAKYPLRIVIFGTAGRLIKLMGVTLAIASLPAFASRQIIFGPTGASAFGTSVTFLPNGNFVVTDPAASVPVSNAGAAHLYSPEGVLINTVTGSSPNDRVGSGGVTELSNGNYVVVSPQWDNGTIADVGAVTRINGETGLAGVVSASNSLIGVVSGDGVGSSGVTALTNGNYVVSSANWDHGAVIDVGAVTWIDGSAGATGQVLPSNSLIGSTTGDQVGYTFVAALRNGNFIVRSERWDNGAAVNAGAVTWGSGTTGIVGVVSAANSLIGSSTNDVVGRDSVTLLTNGNYVVRSWLWDNGSLADAGAATFGNGSIGISGEISPTNSLIGTTVGDRIGAGGITALTNGNYVVRSYNWDNGAIANVGAVTWADGSTGLIGNVTPANSLIGNQATRSIGFDGLTALTNGNFVVRTPGWSSDNAEGVGAITWGNGTTGISGEVSAANSLIGSTAGDALGDANFAGPQNSNGVTALSNGNYVVASPFWNNGALGDAGAVTWVDGSSGLTGLVSAANSFVGKGGDRVGANNLMDDNRITPGVTALANGNYVVDTPLWYDRSILRQRGAVTWANGSTGLIGTISATNSLIGNAILNGNLAGSGGVTALANGNYVVRTSIAQNGADDARYEVSWIDGNAGFSGTLPTTNSLMGQWYFDKVGSLGVLALVDGNVVVTSFRDYQSTQEAAITLADGYSPPLGGITPLNSFETTVVSGSDPRPLDYDATHQQLVIGFPRNHAVGLIRLPERPLFGNGFE